MKKSLSNFHTHTTFCDGKSTPEEIVVAAIENGFSSIGFSGHGYTPFDLRYCMKDTEGYRSLVMELREKYKDSVEVYLGVEEDAFSPLCREKFDYIIGSSHYYVVDGKYLPIDSSSAHFKACLEAFGYDTKRMAEQYYKSFCDYINKRKPDIIGHFDLITKFDEEGESLFLENKDYNDIAEKYLLAAVKSGCIFEVNTGAISRGIRKTVYPAENLLYLLKKEDARIILSSDSHQKETLSFYFDETGRYLYDMGFRSVCTLFGGKFINVDLV